MQERITLFFNPKTTLEEILTFIESRIKNPIITENGAVVFDFNNLPPNYESLNKLEKDIYIIPFNLSTAWGLMYELLPVDLKKQAKILMYNKQAGKYYVITKAKTVVSWAKKIKMICTEILDKVFDKLLEEKKKKENKLEEGQ